MLYSILSDSFLFKPLHFPTLSSRLALHSKILASSIGTYHPLNNDGTHLIGMDHQAIVWCYNLLSVVSDIIFYTTSSSSSLNFDSWTNSSESATRFHRLRQRLLGPNKEKEVPLTFERSLAEPDELLQVSCQHFACIIG